MEPSDTNAQQGTKIQNIVEQHTDDDEVGFHTTSGDGKCVTCQSTSVRACSFCKKLGCSKCFQYLLLPSTVEEAASLGINANEHSSFLGTVQFVCPSCVQSLSAIQFSTHYQVWDEPNMALEQRIAELEKQEQEIIQKKQEQRELELKNQEEKRKLEVEQNNTKTRKFNLKKKESELMSFDNFLDEVGDEIEISKAIQEERRKLKKQTIVILHDAMVNRMNGYPLAMKLKQQYRVVAVDFPKHGSRFFDSKDSTLSMDTCVESVLSALSDLKIISTKRGDDQSLEITEVTERVILLGLTMGSYVAYEIAKRHPMLIHTLIIQGAMRDLYDSVPLSYKLTGWSYKLLPKKALFSLFSWRTGTADKEVLDIMSKRIPINYDAWDECVSIMSNSSIKTALSSFVRATNSCEGFGHIKWIVGENDDRGAESDLKQIINMANTRNDRRVELKIVSGCSDLISLYEDGAEQFVQTITEFLEPTHQ